jgi:uncharacterized protein (TIGR02266 family)
VSDESPAPTRATVRVPFEAEVVVEFERFSGFLAEYSSNLSLGGMFLTTRYLKPVGSDLRFEVRLKDSAPLVRGRGVVAWTRWQDQGPRRPAGMGVRFVDLDPQSRELIYKLVDERLKSGKVGEELALDAAALADITGPQSVTDLAGPRLPETPPATPVPAGLPGIEPPAPSEPPPAAAQPFDIAPPADLPASPPPSRAGERPVSPVPAPPPLEEIVARASASWTSPAPRESPATRPPERGAVPPPAAPAPVTFAAARASSARRGRVPILVGGLALLAASALGILWWVDRRPRTPPAPAVTATPSATAAPETPAAAPAGPSEAAAPAAPVGPSPPPAAAPAPPPPAARFSALEKVTWEEENGVTVLALWLDGAIPEGSFERSRIEGREPREVIRLRGARGPVAPARFDVGTPEVRRVRTGLHAAGASSELHVVVDLATGARVLDARVDGRQLVLRVVFR